MLIDFFYTLRARQAAGLGQGIPDAARGAEGRRDRPTATTAPTIDDFYYLARTALVKDEAHFDKFDRAFAAYFKGVELLTDFTQDDPARVAAARTLELELTRRGEGQDREDGLGRADGDAEEALRGAEGAPRGRQQDDRHRRHLALRRLRLQPAGHPHRPGQGPQQERGEGLGPARLQGLRRHARSSARATSRSRCAGCAASRAKAPRKSSTSTTPSTRPRPTPAGSTSRWCPSATTT